MKLLGQVWMRIIVLPWMVHVVLSTVCGKIWLDVYQKSLNKEDKTKVCHNDGVEVFKFGCGTK